jgi:hypothetical protein
MPVTDVRLAMSNKVTYCGVLVGCPKYGCRDDTRPRPYPSASTHANRQFQAKFVLGGIYIHICLSFFFPLLNNHEAQIPTHLTS